MEEGTPSSASQVKKKRVKKKVLKKRVKTDKRDDNGENGGELLAEPKAKGDEGQAPGSRRGSFLQEKTVSKVPDNKLSKLFSRNYGMLGVAGSLPDYIKPTKYYQKGLHFVLLYKSN